MVAADLGHGDETFHEAAEFLRADRGGLDGFVFDQAACEVDQHGLAVTAVAVEFGSMYEVTHDISLPLEAVVLYLEGAAALDIELQSLDVVLQEVEGLERLLQSCGCDITHRAASSMP